jgi:hypothetical protein
MFFMSVPNILWLIVTSFGIIFNKAPYIYAPYTQKIRLLADSW